MQKAKLKKMFSLTATNFKFKLDEDFGIFFEMIEEKIKNIPDELVTKRFQQLWLTTTEEWNKQYGYSGYPSFADWILILTGKRALTDLQIEEEKARHESSLKNLVSNVFVWINEHDDQLQRVLNYRYENPENKRICDFINDFCGVKGLPNYEEIGQIGFKLKKMLEEDKENLKSKLLTFARQENQLLLD